jgi:hypothetical protein
MDNKVDRWLIKRSEDIKEEWVENVNYKLNKCQSEIEKLFMIEFLYQNEWGGSLGILPDDEVFIFPQFKINNYKVDFMIFVASFNEWSKDGLNNYPSKHKEKCLIVELDSYLWHGSDPEQFTKEKTREREIIKEGYNIMRFSGREIYRNVEKCVEEITEHFWEENKKIIENKMDDDR